MLLRKSGYPSGLAGFAGWPKDYVARTTRILTAEVSGIVPAIMAAKALDNIPLVYARKHKPITMREPVYLEVAPSHTKGGEVNLMVSPEFLYWAIVISIS